MRLDVISTILNLALDFAIDLKALNDQLRGSEVSFNAV
jgi:hypothetical protein